MAWYQKQFEREDPQRPGWYKEDEAALREVDFIMERLGLDPGSRILDLCCGQGRHMVELIRRGYDVVGVDLSSYMLSGAREALEAAGVHSCLVQSDMREINFFEEFDGVINMRTSFGYLESDEEDQKALNRVAFALKPGGRFLIDLMHRDELMGRFGEHLWNENERGDILLKENKFDVLTGRSACREITFFADGRKVESHHVIRLYTYNEMERMLRTAGLEVESTYGSFDSSPFTHKSRRMMIVANKV